MNDQFEVMGALGRLLDEAGYAELYRAVAGDRLPAVDAAAARRTVSLLPSPEREMASAFIFGDDVDVMHGDPSSVRPGAAGRSLAISASDGAKPTDRGPGIPGNPEGHLPEARVVESFREGFLEVTDRLVQVGLAVDGSSGRHTTGWIVVPYNGGYLLVDRFAPYGGGDVHVYIGNDSLMLGSLVRCPQGAKLLDLGAGSGIFGLLSAGAGNHATLVDIDARSIAFCRLNEALNRSIGRLDHPVRILQGDLFEPVQGERFDVIVTLAPYVPSISIGQVPLFADGGEDGLAVLGRVLDEAPAHLEEGGELLALMQVMIGPDRRPLVCDMLDDILVREAELGRTMEVRMTLHDVHYLWPYALDLAGQLAMEQGAQVASAETETGSRMAGNRQPADQVEMAERMVASWRGMGVSCVATALLRLRHTGRATRTDDGSGEGSGEGSPKRGAHGRDATRDAGGRPVDGSRDGVGQLELVIVDVPWLPSDIPVLRGEGLAGPSHVLTVSAPGAGTYQVDVPTAKLLGACDGRRSLSEIVPEVWPEGSSSKSMSLLDVAMEKCARLEKAGMLARRIGEVH